MSSASWVQLHRVAARRSPEGALNEVFCLLMMGMNQKTLTIKKPYSGDTVWYMCRRENPAGTNLDELHPLDSFGADGHHGEADGGANNAVSPRNRQFEEGGD